MNVHTFLVETIVWLLESSVIAGAVLREALGYDDGPAATVDFTILLCLVVAVVALYELALRWQTGADHVLVPDTVLEAQPDLGFSTWVLLYAFAILQGVGSAFV